MSTVELTYFKGLLSAMPIEKQEAIKKLRDEIKVMVDGAGDIGVYALTLYGLEMQSECP